MATARSASNGVIEVFDMATGRLWGTSIEFTPDATGWHADIMVREYCGPFELCNVAGSIPVQSVTHRYDADGLNEAVKCRRVQDTCALWAVPLSHMGAQVIRSGKAVNSLIMKAENCSGTIMACEAGDAMIFSCMRGDPPASCSPYDMTAAEIAAEEAAARPQGAIPPTVVLEAPEPREESGDVGDAQTVCVYCRNRGKCLVCGECNDVHYCSKRCQRLDWAKHKKHCRSLSTAQRGKVKPDIEPMPPQLSPVSTPPPEEHKDDAPDRVVFDLQDVPVDLRGTKPADIIKKAVAAGASPDEMMWLLDQLVNGVSFITDHSPRYVARVVGGCSDGNLDDTCRMAATYQDYFSGKYGMPRDLTGCDRLMVRCKTNQGSQRHAFYYIKFGSDDDAAISGGRVLCKDDVERALVLLSMASDSFFLRQTLRPPRVGLVLAATRGFVAAGAQPNWDPGHYGFYVNADGSPVPPDLSAFREHPHGWLHLFRDVPGFVEWRDSTFEWLTVEGEARVRARDWPENDKVRTTFRVPWHYRRAFAELVFRRDKEELGSIHGFGKPPMLRMGGGYGALATIKSISSWSGFSRYCWRRADCDFIYTGVIPFDDF